VDRVVEPAIRAHKSSSTPLKLWASSCAAQRTVQYDCICACEVQPLPPSACGEQEGKDVIVVVEAVHGSQALVHSYKGRAGRGSGSPEKPGNLSLLFIHPASSCPSSPPFQPLAPHPPVDPSRRTYGNCSTSISHSMMSSTAVHWLKMRGREPASRSYRTGDGEGGTAGSRIGCSGDAPASVLLSVSVLWSPLHLLEQPLQEAELG
jgi:hypothetical protein